MTFIPMRIDVRNIGTVAAGCLCSWAAAANGLYWANEGPAAPENGAGTEFGRSELSLTLPLEYKKRGAEQVSSSFHLDMSKFRWSGTTALQNDYFWISLPLEYRQKRGKNAEFLLRAEPGFMTDFNVLDSESLAMNADLIGRIYRRSGAFWQFGLTVNREFGDFNPRPVIGMATKATRDTEVLLGFPQTRIQTRWSNDLSSYVHLRPAGGVWVEEVKDQTGTFKANYTNWKLGLGGEFHWRGALWLTAELGQMRHRRIVATDTTGVQVKATPADDRYWQAGIELRY